jgi:serine phosphatase RsbU (regulator of sigma subunit)
VDPEEDYPVTTVLLTPGDTLLMVTDGITEARRDGEILGYEGFLRLAIGALSQETLPRIKQAILEGAQSFARGQLQDDACLLLARWQPTPVPACGVGPAEALPLTASPATAAREGAAGTA